MKNKKQSSYAPEIREIHKQNQNLSMEDVTASLGNDVRQYTKIVGKWLWIEFPEKPDDTTREEIYALGFQFSPKRMAWMHCCGVKVKGHARNYHPKEKYGEEDLQPAASAA